MRIRDRSSVERIRIAFMVKRDIVGDMVGWRLGGKGKGKGGVVWWWGDWKELEGRKENCFGCFWEKGYMWGKEVGG